MEIQPDNQTPEQHNDKKYSKHLEIFYNDYKRILNKNDLFFEMMLQKIQDCEKNLDWKKSDDYTIRNIKQFINDKTQSINYYTYTLNI